ncbi:hypothetical protein AADZ90_003140 [Aestuariibius sp. 2305UL40-4]|uniref:hypothetical protein n=1 Tax=Aestuariibius violaceus TaxID=3234132 RepID=UPI00345E2DF3
MDKAWAIFSHAVRMVFRSLNVLPRIAAPLIILVVAGPYIISAMSGVPLETVLNQPAMMPSLDPDAMSDEQREIMTALSGPNALVGIAQLLATLWVAVAWHRYVLSGGDAKAADAPPGRVLAYLGWGVLIGLILALVLFIPIIFAAVVPALGIPLVMVAIVAAVAASYRLSAVLPAAAIGKAEGLGAVWKATEGTTLIMIVLALISTVAAFVIALILGAIFSIFPTVIQPVLFAIPNVLFTLVYASILTTIYGHYIEGRDFA